MEYVRLILAAVLGYLLGSMNTSIIVGKFYGIDVRNHGSGNAGATNTLRTLGKKAA
ncbi:MAG TPA: glycerol-3-phosphate acyltransferase, partial [Clostridia bacterium]